MRIQRLIRRRLRGAEVELLRLVESRPAIGSSDAAWALHLAGNFVSPLVNQLVRDGYLLRETDPADRRAARLQLAAAAGKRLDDWKRRRTELVGRHVSRLDDTDRGGPARGPAGAAQAGGRPARRGRGVMTQTDDHDEAQRP